MRQGLLPRCVYILGGKLRRMKPERRCGGYYLIACSCVVFIETRSPASRERYICVCVRRKSSPNKIYVFIKQIWRCDYTRMLLLPGLFGPHVYWLNPSHTDTRESEQSETKVKAKKTYFYVYLHLSSIFSNRLWLIEY